MVVGIIVRVVSILFSLLSRFLDLLDATLTRGIQPVPCVSLLFAESSFEAVHGDLALDDFRRAVDDEDEDRQDV